MATNYVKPGDHITVTNSTGAAIDAGAGCLLGSLFGVAIVDMATSAEGVIATKGVWYLAKTSAQAWTVGVKIYWDDTAKVATTTASTNKLIGVATQAAANPSASGYVLLSGAFTV